MVRLKGTQYFIAFIFQICFWKLIVIYLVYLFHTNSNLYASVIQNEKEADKIGSEIKN